MAKAKKLPSGKWRAQAYYKDKAGNIYRPSFTAGTKREAEMMAEKFMYDTDHRLAGNDTVEQATKNYLETNRATLSPSTLLNYSKDAKRFKSINNIKINKLTSTDIQEFISQLTESGLSPKTVKNTYGLLRSVLSFSGIDKKFMIHLPKAQKKLSNAPENEQIMALYNAASHKMKVAIMLASRHSLRRGEICGLLYGDLKGNTLYVHSDMVMGPDGWVHKETPKTSTSNRTVYLTDEEVELIGQGNSNDYIVPLTPGTIGTNFYNLKKKLGIDIRFHDLRVYFASVSAALGIPEIYTAHHGGWKEGSKVLQDHYRKPIASIDEGYAKKLNDYFSSLTTHELLTENVKSLNQAEN